MTIPDLWNVWRESIKSTQGCFLESLLSGTYEFLMMQLHEWEWEWELWLMLGNSPIPLKSKNVD